MACSLHKRKSFHDQLKRKIQGIIPTVTVSMENQEQGIHSLLYSELEHRILHGLSLEWQAALSILGSSRQPAMKQPVFSLKHSEKSLAHWDSSKREISFSRRFVLNYPWDSIREVLIHEMAHQYASEVLMAHHETPHGPGFMKACQALKANPGASGSYKPLTDRINDEELPAQDRIMVKVKKLLSLGNSVNTFEAESAVAKAHELIRKHNIDLLEKNTERQFVSLFVGEPSLKRYREEYLLSHVLMEHYYVYGIWVPAFVLHKGKMGRVFEITGTIENVKIASYVYDFITRHMDMAWIAYNKGKHLNRSRKSDFSSGLIQGFKQRLESEESSKTTVKSRSQGARQPMVIEDAQLKEYAAFKYPRIRRFSRTALACDENVINAGKTIGKNLVLNKAVERRSEIRSLPLPVLGD